MVASNCYLIISGTHAAVVDPSEPVEAITDCAAKEGVTVEYILLTHGHFDHIFELDALASATGAKVCIHKYDADKLCDPEKNFASFFRLNTVSSTKPAMLLSDGDTISLGDEKITVLHTPGHSVGSVCFCFDDTLVSGDTLFAGTIGRYDFPDSSFDALSASLDKLFTLPESTKVYPGHGGTTTIGDERKYNMYFRYKN